MCETGQSRRLSDVGMSASPPTTDLSLRRSEPTLWANFCRERLQQNAWLPRADFWSRPNGPAAPVGALASTKTGAAAVLRR